MRSQNDTVLPQNQHISLHTISRTEWKNQELRVGAKQRQDST